MTCARCPKRLRQGDGVTVFNAELPTCFQLGLRILTKRPRFYHPATLQRGASNLEFAFVRLRCVASCTSRGPCKVEVAPRRAPKFRATLPTSCPAFSFQVGRGRYRAASRSAAAAPKHLWLERRSGVSDHCRMQPLLAAASLMEITSICSSLQSYFASQH